MNTWIRRHILDDHRLLTIAACINLAGLLAAAGFDLSDRTFYAFLIAAVVSGLLALRAADRAIDSALDDPDPFAMQLRIEYREDQP
jgi:hypothetical protein